MVHICTCVMQKFLVVLMGFSSLPRMILFNDPLDDLSSDRTSYSASFTFYGMRFFFPVLYSVFTFFVISLHIRPILYPLPRMNAIPTPDNG